MKFMSFRILYKHRITNYKSKTLHKYDSSLQHISVFYNGYLRSLAAVLQSLLLVMLLIYINNRCRKECCKLNLFSNQQQLFTKNRCTSTTVIYKKNRC
jgi:hypothetical protein